jgi:hypothetical protein
MKKSRRRQRGKSRPALEWRAARSVKRQDELRSDEQILATMRWESMWSTLATGTARAGQWSFERPRLLSRDIEVRIPGTTDDAPWAVFSPGWTSEGTLCLADGRQFHWQCTDFWQTEWVFVSAAGEPLVRFTDTSGFLSQSTAVGIVRAKLSESDRALLVLLGHYLMVLQARDRAATTAAVTAAVV